MPDAGCGTGEFAERLRRALDAAALRDYVAVTMTHAHLASRVPPDLDSGFAGEARHAVFVAEKAG